MSFYNELKRRNVFRLTTITHVTSRRLDYIIIAMLAVAIGLFGFDRFLPVGAGLARDDRAQSAASDDRAQGALLQETPAIAVDDKSIAVLPFVNMSSDKEQEYFSDGMSDMPWRNNTLTRAVLRPFCAR